MSLNTLTLNDFTGGLDLVTSLASLQPQFTPDSINWTINEDGSLEKIQGWQSLYTAPSSIDGLFAFDNDGSYTIDSAVADKPPGTPYGELRIREGLTTTPYSVSSAKLVFMNVGTDIISLQGPLDTPTTVTLADDPAYPAGTWDPGTGAIPIPAKPTAQLALNASAVQFDYFMLFLDDNNEMRSTPGDPDGVGGSIPDYTTLEWHPWTGDGTADTPVLRNIDVDSTAPPKGKLLAVWNRTVYMRPKSFPNLLKWSNPGDPFNWPGTNEIEFSSGDTGGEIVAAIPTPGALLVLATDAVYRVYDQFTGAYTVLSRDGCTNGASVREVDGLVYYMSDRGIMATDGNSAPQLVSRLIDPLILGRLTRLDTAAGFRRDGRYYCAINRPQAGTGLTLNTLPAPPSFENNLTLELLPQLNGAIMASGMPVKRAVETRTFKITSFDVVFVDSRDDTELRVAFLSGLDNGDPILARHVTAPLDMGTQEFQKRIRRTRIVGRGEIRVNDIIDYTGDVRYLPHPTGDGAVDRPLGTEDLILTFGVGGQWDIAQWDDGVWGDWALNEGWSRMNRRGRTHSYVFISTLSGDNEGRPIFGGSGEARNGVTIALVEPHFSVHEIRRRR